jgi:hypothetical protein
MSVQPDTFGRTIQLFLVDGTPTGLRIASIHGWTGSVLVASQATFGNLLARPEADRTGLYILYGPDPEEPLAMRAYIGEADCVRDRIDQSASARSFWETAVVITTSDETLTKGHVRYLEARLIDVTKSAARVLLDNSQAPAADRRRLPEADKANMESFLENLKTILPVVGLDLLKNKSSATRKAAPTAEAEAEVIFEIRHKSGVRAKAVQENDEFVVLAGSQALKDTGYSSNQYARLKQELIETGVLVPVPSGVLFEFKSSYAFGSPSAAGAVVLDRNTNGRTTWLVVGGDINYHEWQEQKAQAARPTDQATAASGPDKVLS